MCELCGQDSGTEKINLPKGVYWFVCLKCWGLMSQNRAISDWVTTIVYNMREKFEESFRVQLNRYEFQSKVDERLELQKNAWIQEAKREVEKHVRSEVQKVLFVEGMGSK